MIPAYTARELLDYGSYVAVLRAQEVRPMDRDAWIDGKRRSAAGWAVVFQTVPGARLPHGWYVNVFGPNSNGYVTRVLGPFLTETEAQTAKAAL